MSFLAPLYLLGLLSAIPIILLWFLKQRREIVEVPTTFLWRKTAEEERVSPLIKNLTVSLLLLLQLIALALLAFAAASAVLNLRLSGDVRHVILLVDRSASMGTTEDDGETRMDRARESAETLLDSLRGADRGMLIAFDRTARILSGFTTDTTALGAHLARIAPRDAGTDPAEALRVAEAAAAALPEGRVEVFLFSDGAFPPVAELPPALEGASFTFVGVGETDANAGITGLSLETTLEGNARLFASVANAGPDPVTRTLALIRDDRTLDAREAQIEPRSRAGAAFDLTEWGPGPFELRLEPADALAADDHTHLTLADEPVRRILLVTDGNPVLARLKDFHPGVEVYTVPPAEAGPDLGEGVGRFDLTVFDGTVPEGVLPGTGWLGPSAVYIACAPAGQEGILGPGIVNPDVVDWDRSHPLNRHVEWSDVLVASASPLRPASAAAALLETTEGALIAALPGGGTRVVFAFRLEDSNLSLRLAFPIFFANLLNQAFRPGGASEAGFLPAGESLVRTLPAGVETALVVDPDGRETEIARLPDGTVTFSDTDRTGFYSIRIGPSREVVPVSFLSEAETDIAPRETVDIAGVARPSDPEAVDTNFPLRRPLLFAALAVLLLEWTIWLRGLARRRARSPVS